MKSEWSESLIHIENALVRDLYHRLGDIQLEGFVTDKSLSVESAQNESRKSFDTDYVWGEPGKYAWMFSTIQLPSSAKNERIVMNLNLGGEATLFVDGSPFGTRRADWVTHSHHFFVDQTLTKRAEGDETFELCFEVYAGHPMPRESGGSCSTGPVFPEEEQDIMLYKPATVGKNSYGFFNEEAYQLYLDILILREIMENGDENDFRIEAIEYGLKDLIVAMDMEQPLQQRRLEYIKMRELLAPLMQAKNGSSAPRIEAVANSHLDVAWMWDFGETRRKTARTFAAQLRLLEEYPEAIFVQSQPILYEMCKEHYPEVFEGIKRMVKSGQWIADGAMWVEPDTNLSSGESLIRQFLYGKRYFKDEFGVDSRLCWLPDTFGYTAALPQILKGCGVDYLTTQKIYWTYNDSEKFPYHGFAWQGMDSTRINSYVHMRYETPINPTSVMTHWKNRMEQDGSGQLFMPFGYGDGGGGPTRDDMEQIRRTTDLEGTPKVSYTTPHDFMTQLDANTPIFKRNIFVGELYFPCHRGTYTTQSDVKKGNRMAETAMHDTELWSTVAKKTADNNYDQEVIEKCWKNVLLNQFHDILPGSSIDKVYEDAMKLYDEVFEATHTVKDNAIGSIVSGNGGATYFNGTSFEREGYVYLPDNFESGAIYQDGTPLQCTKTEKGLLAKIAVPACGHVSVIPAEQTTPAKQVSLIALDNGAYKLENSKLIAVVQRDGTLSECISKSTGRQYINGIGNKLRMFRDIPRKFDSWDIDVMTELCETELDSSSATLEVITTNDLEVTLKSVKTVGGSPFSQLITLRADEQKIDFDTTIDWKELHKLLKVSFATGIESDSAKNQIQFGFVERPTHRTLACDSDRFEVCNHYYTAINDATHGAALLNDSKYGISMLGDELSLTLLKTGAFPDFRSDNQIHRLSYSFMFWDTEFEKSPVVKDSYFYNQPLLCKQGTAPDTSYFSLSDERIVIETIKISEDGDDVIIRMYESMQGERDCELRIKIPFTGVEECDMLENPTGELQSQDGRIQLRFRPFEIKTLRIK